jgi:thiamine biosynthesis lipoprotein
VSDPLTASFPAFGSSGLIAAATTDSDSLLAGATAAQAIVASFDLACSRFRSDSDLARLNEAVGRPVHVSELFIEAAEAALRAARLTGGAVDPTVGRALIELGYDRDFAQLGEVEHRSAGVALLQSTLRMTVRSVPGWECVELDHDKGTARLPKGVRLDLGATAKALAADRAAAAAAEAAGCGTLVSLGGDLRIAADVPADGWRIRVTDDHRADVSAPGQWITLTAGGLATSSTTTRRWHGARGNAHHLLEPATGLPASSPWRTASVTAATCLDANIASARAIIRGDDAAAWLEALGLPARLVGEDGTVTHVGGWPQEGDDLL